MNIDARLAALRAELNETMAKVTLRTTTHEATAIARDIRIIKRQIKRLEDKTAQMRMFGNAMVSK